MKAYWGSGGVAPRILGIGTRWRWVVSCTPRPLYPRERAPGTRWIGGWVGLRAGVEYGGGEKNSQLLPGLEPPIIQPVAQRYTTELSWLHVTLEFI
jgi:hypothetical protein